MGWVTYFRFQLRGLDIWLCGITASFLQNLNIIDFEIIEVALPNAICSVALLSNIFLCISQSCLDATLKEIICYI